MVASLRSMTKAHSSVGDNDGLCESCNDPKTRHQTQTTYPVLLAGLGPGGMPAWGTMWLCSACLKARHERDQKKQP
jgi:hypothetical protein